MRVADCGAPEGIKGQTESIRAALKADPQIARDVGDSLPAQVAKVYEELTGKELSALMHEPHLARHAHTRSHGLVSA